MLDQGDLVQVISLQPVETDVAASSKIVFERFFCQSCHEQSFLTLKESVSTTNSKGQVEEKSTDIIELVTLTPELSDLFTARFMAPQRGPELSPA